MFTCNSQHTDGSIPPKGETVVRTTEPNIGMFVLMLIYLSISIISTDMIFLTILISVRLFVCLFVCFLVLVCFLSVFCFVFVSGFNVFPTVNFEKRFDVFVQKPYCVQDTIHHLKTFSFHCSSSDFFFFGGGSSFLQYCTHDWGAQCPQCPLYPLFLLHRGAVRIVQSII